MLKSWKSWAGAMCLALAVTGSARAESFTTLFGVVPNPGLPTVLAGPGELSLGVGEFPGVVEIDGAEINVLNGLESFTSFNVQNLNDGTPLAGSSNTGQTIFLQNANFYVGGGQLFPGAPFGPEPPAALGPAPAGPIAQQAISDQGQLNLAALGVIDTNPSLDGLQTFNNRAFGVFGQGRSDIVFDVEAQVTEVILQAGVTLDEFSIGANPAFGQSLPEGTPLADGDGLLLIYTDLGLEAQIEISDINQDISLSIGDLSGDAITRLSVINQSTALNSAAFLTELTVTASGLGGVVPEPSALGLLSLAGIGLMGRRR